MAGNAEILRLLLDKDPHELLRCRQPVHSLHIAVARGHTECVEIIIAQARKGTMTFF